MTTWRWFARREFPRAVRDLGSSAALSIRGDTLTHCPLHTEVRLGRVSRKCQVCHDALWADIGRRYVEPGRPKNINTNPKEEA